MVLRSHPFFLIQIAFFLFSLDEATLMEQACAAKTNCKKGVLPRVTVTNMAQLYDRDDTHSSAIYVLSTLLSIMTMPLMNGLFALML